MNKINTILISLTIALFFIVGITCQNSLVQSGNTTDETPTTTIDTTKRGSLRIYIEENIKTRTIITDASAIAFDQYSLELTSDDGFADRSAVFTSNVAVFNNIEAGSWNIAVKAKQAGLVLATGALYNKTITADTTTDLTVDIKLNQSATGNVNIRISFPDDSEVDYVEAQLFEDTDYTALSIIDNSPDVDHKMVVFERNNVTSGMIDLLLTFKKGGASGTILGMYREAVNIFDNLTSDKWIDGTTLKSVLLYSATDFASTNANLLNLKVSYGGIVFSSSNYFYNIFVPNSVSTFSVKPTEGIIGQSIFAKFNGGLASIVKTDTSSDTFALNVGDNTIDVEVTAQDYWTKKNYIITINRAPIPTTPVLLDGIFDITSDALYGVDKNLSLTSENSTQIRYTMTQATGSMPPEPSIPTIASLQYSAPISLTANSNETTTYKIKAVGFNDFGDASAVGGVWTVTIDKEPPDTPTIGTIVSGGKYSSNQKFTLISADADKIYYTIISRIGSIPADPADPTSGSGILYNNTPIDLTADSGQTKYYKIKAIAYDKVNNPSAIGGVWTVTFDIQPPYVISYSPTLNATGVSPTANLVLTFDETVDIGTGNIYIKTSVGDVTVDTLPVNGTKVVSIGKIVTIDPSIIFVDMTQYYVIIDPTAFKDSVGNFYAGINLRDTWKFSTGDTTAPNITGISSTPLSGNFKQGEVISIDVTFNEIVNVLLGPPTLSLNSGGTASLSGGSGTTKLTFTYTIASWNNTADLDVTTINPNGATIKDLTLNDANLTLPVSPNRLMDNSAIVIDTTAPSVPVISGISAGSYNVNQTFDITGEADATIDYSLNNGTSWNVYSSQITLSSEGTYEVIARQTDLAGNNSVNTALITVVIDKTAPTAFVTYSITADTSKDVTATLSPSESVTVTNNGGSNAYIFSTNGNFTFNFTDAAGNTGSATATVSNIDTTAPTAPSYNPSDGATNVLVSANLVINFSENVNAVAGNNIVIKRVSDGSPYATFPVDNATYVSGIGTPTITINPSTDLEFGTGYYIQIDAGAFTDAAGNNYAGIADNTTWNFTTKQAGNITVSINLLSPTDYTVTFTPNVTNINKNLGESLFVSAVLDGATAYQWYLDGAAYATTSSISVSSLSLSLGVHNLAVVVTKLGQPYSAQTNFSVVSY